MSPSSPGPKTLSALREPSSGGSEDRAEAKLELKYLLRALIKYNASDLHLKAGRPPLYRIHGKLVPAKMAEITEEGAQAVILGMLSHKQITDLETKRQIDCSFRVAEFGRFRCSIYYQRGALSAAIRMIPSTVPTLDELEVPSVLKELCLRPRGLLLVTGATGVGKSTTLAAMIQYINQSNPIHILTLEDPIEFLFRDIKASVTQREVGSDTPSLREGLIAGLRQDPDVIMIGEVRDAETIQAALTAAETGHLVLTTLHTNDAKSSIERILDVFQPSAQNQIRIQLASTLVGVVTQQLLPRADGSGRIPACEVMVKSPTIESYILRNEIEKIPEAIASSNNYYKMQSMNQALEKLVVSGKVVADEALKSASNPADLKLRLSGMGHEDGFVLE